MHEMTIHSMFFNYKYKGVNTAEYHFMGENKKELICNTVKIVFIF